MGAKWSFSSLQHHWGLRSPGTVLTALCGHSPHVHDTAVAARKADIAPSAQHFDKLDDFLAGQSHHLVNVRFTEAGFGGGLSLPVRSFERCRGHPGPFPKRP